MMSRIVVEAEKDGAQRLLPQHQTGERLSIAETICEAMAHAARDLDLMAIAVFTESGMSARMLSKYRPVPRIYAFTSGEAVCNRMNLLWGVTPLLCPASLSVQRMGEFAEVRAAAVAGRPGRRRVWADCRDAAQNSRSNQFSAAHDRGRGENISMRGESDG